MKKALLAVGLLLAALIILNGLFVAATHIYHSRRFRECSDELEAALRSKKTFESFKQDPRPDGLWRRYSHQERNALLAEAAGWAHTERNAADMDSMSQRAHTSAIFRFSDMVYVLFFDQDDRLREFVCLSN